MERLFMAAVSSTVGTILIICIFLRKNCSDIQTMLLHLEETTLKDKAALCSAFFVF